MYEFYPTPRDTVEDLLRTGFMMDNCFFLEPCAGRGDIINTVKKWNTKNVHYTGVEIDKNHIPYLREQAHNTHQCDFLRDFNLPRKYDRMIVNPPYSKIHNFIEKCHGLLKPDGKMAFIIPLSSLTGKSRYNLYTSIRPSHIYILSTRPNLCHSEQPNMHQVNISGYAWVVWNKNSNHDVTYTDWIL